MSKGWLCFRLLRGALMLSLFVTMCGCGQQFTVEVKVVPEEGGTIIYEPEQSGYKRKTALMIEAIPAEGWRFVEWRDQTDGRPRCGRQYSPVESEEARVYFTIQRNMMLTAVFEAQQVDAPGALKVTLMPDAAVAVGARWRVDEGMWQSSGAVAETLETGTYGISYYPVPGWNAPPSETMVVTPGETFEAQRSYSPAMPQAPENAEAQSGPESVLLTWDEQNLYTVRGYHVYRAGLDADIAARLNSEPVRALRYRDYSGELGVPYAYHVTAVTASDVESAPSEASTGIAGQVTLRLPLASGWPGDPVRLPIAAVNAEGLQGDMLEMVVQFLDNSTGSPVDVLRPDSIEVVATAITRDTSPVVTWLDMGRLRIEAGTPDAPALTGEGRLFEIAGYVSDVLQPDDMIEIHIDAAETHLFSGGYELYLDASSVGMLVINEDCMRGDVDNSTYIEAADADMLLDIATKLVTPDDCHWQAGDLNSDRRLNSADAVVVLRLIEGWYDSPDYDGALSLGDILMPENEVRVTVSGASVAAGDEVLIPVQVTMNDGLYGTVVVVGYPADDALLRLVGAAPDQEFLAGAVSVNTSEPGIVRIVLSRAITETPTVKATDPITLAWMRFRVGINAPEAYAPPLTLLKVALYGPYGELADWYTPIIWEDGQIDVTANEGEESVAQPVLSVTPSRLSVGAAAGTAVFAVNNAGEGTLEWSAQTVEEYGWFYVEVVPGEGEGGASESITIFYNQNETYTSRTGAISIVAPGALNSPQTVYLTQTGTVEPEGEGEGEPGLFIALSGDSEIYLDYGQPYTDPGIQSIINLATMEDIWNESLAGSVQISIMSAAETLYTTSLLEVADSFNAVFTTIPDTYTLEYYYALAPGVEGSVQRMVTVYPDTWINELQTPEMVSTPAGPFEMGRPYSDVGDVDELPVHEVYLDAHLVGKYPVTNQEYADALNWALARGYLTDEFGSPYSGGLVFAYGQFIADTQTSNLYSQLSFSGGAFSVRSRLGHDSQMYSMADHPVVMVNWYGAIAYCNWLSEATGLQPCYDTSTWMRYDPVQNGYRLPTEAEWEQTAAWDGVIHWRYGGTSNEIDYTRANYNSVNPIGLTSEPYTTPVGWYNGVNPAQLLAPEIMTLDSPSYLGAYDMSGNVIEWCYDWYQSDYYSSSPSTNPTGPVSGSYRAVRGGSWSGDDLSCRAAARNDLYRPDSPLRYLGFRLAQNDFNAVEGEGEPPIEGEGEPPIEGEGEPPIEGEGEPPIEGEGEPPIEGEGEPPVMVAVPEGLFDMGRPYVDEGNPEELPVHSIYLDAYEIGLYPVTNQEYANVLNWAQTQGYLTDDVGGAYAGGLIYAYGQLVADIEGSSASSQLTYGGGIFGVRTRLGYNSQSFSMADHPVVQISWYGAVAYCNWISEMQGLQPCYNTTTWNRYEPLRNGYRLPTEAEWERAAAWDGVAHVKYGVTNETLQDSQANHYFFNGVDFTYVNPLGLIDFPYTSPVGWFDGINPVQVSQPTNMTLNSASPVGAYDIAGNVSEWCHDWYQVDYYSVSSGLNPTGPATGTNKVTRGGNWGYDALNCRAAYRSSSSPDSRGNGIGFRIAR